MTKLIVALIAITLFVILPLIVLLVCINSDEVTDIEYDQVDENGRRYYEDVMSNGMVFRVYEDNDR